MVTINLQPGCLSDALGLGAGGRAWSALASPASPPAAPLSLRPASAAPPDEPDLADPGFIPYQEIKQLFLYVFKCLM